MGDPSGIPVDAVESPVPYGRLVDGRVHAEERPKLAASPPVDRCIMPDGNPDHREDAEVVRWDRRSLRYFATPRLSGSLASRVLTRRGVCDISNQLRFDSEYIERYPDPSHRGSVTNPEFLEWMQGVPLGWTSTRSARVAVAGTGVGHRPRLRGVDLFTGCGGLTLGLHPWVDVVAYCEINPKYSDVIRRRIEVGDLDDAPILADVRCVDAQALGPNGADIVCAGFPCQNISNIGDRSGLQGPKSGLFSEVQRLVGELRPCYVFLENVAAITCTKMLPALSHVLLALDSLGYDAKWALLEASHAGAPQRRQRWFLLAWNRQQARPLEALRSIVPPLSAKEQAHMSASWAAPPALEDRLLLGTSDPRDPRGVGGVLHKADGRTNARLQMLGNAVCAPQAAMALRYLAWGGLHGDCGGFDESPSSAV